jgi:hypothetical protein
MSKNPFSPQKGVGVLIFSMKKTIFNFLNKLNIFIFISILILNIHSTFAFNPPSSPPPNATATLQADQNNNLGIGGPATSTSKLTIYGTTTIVSGYLGIGVSIPGWTIDVGDGTIKAQYLLGSLRASDVIPGPFRSGSGNYAFPTSLAVGTSTTTGLPQTLSVYGGAYISGNVGIGTTTPVSELHVNGIITLGVDTAVGSLNFRGSGAAYIRHVTYGGEIVLNPSGNLRLGPGSNVYFGNPGTERVTILTSGNVGIGTTAPGEKLTVWGGVISAGSAYSGGRIFIGDDDGTNIKIYTDGTRNLKLYAGGDIILDDNVNFPGSGIWNSTGNVGIGTTNPGAKLDVRGDVLIGDSGNLGLRDDANNDFYIENWNWGKDMIFRTRTSGGTMQSNLVIKESGYVGIGTTTPSEKLVVAGNAIVTGTLNAGTISGSLGGSVTISAANISQAVFGTGTSNGTSSLYAFPSKLGIATTSYVNLPQELSVYGGAYIRDDVGIGTTAPRGKLDLTGTGDIWVKTVRFVSNDVGWGEDNSDPYLLEKVHDSPNVSHLDLHLNDDANEEFRIYGFSCNGYGCGVRSGNLYHFFRSDGTAYHAGNVGIGTTNPTGKLDVKGGRVCIGGAWACANNYMASGSLTIGDISLNYGGGSGWNANTAGLLLEASANTEIAVHDSGTRIASLMYYEGDNTNRITIGRDMGSGAISTVAINGNVGIGTTNPTGKLDVKGGRVCIGGAWACANNYMASGSLTIGDISLNYGGGSGWNANTAGLLLEASANTEIAVHDSGTRIASLMYYEGDNTNRITIGRDMGSGAISTVAINGYVGIGTTTPSEKLVVAGNIVATGTITGSQLCISGDCKSSWPQGVNGSGITNYIARWTTSTSIGTSTIYQDTSGKIGINTTTPTYELTVAGSIYSTGNIIGTVNASLISNGTFGSSVGTSGADYSFLGKVGIGTTTPGAKLHVASGLIETGTRGVKQGLSFVDSCGTTRVTSVHNGIWAPDYSGGCGDEWFIGAQDRDGGEASTLVIGMWNDANDHIALMPSGNVGIGTTAPEYKLDY